jgi:hypothetical protein
MDIKTQINDFLELSKNLGYNPVEIYHQAPMGIYAIVGIVVIVLIIILSIKSSLKNSKESALLNEAKSINQYDDMIDNLQEIIQKAPKANKNFILFLNEQKEEILKHQIQVAKNSSITKTIDNLEKLSDLYIQLADNLSSNEELYEYFKNKATQTISSKIKNSIDKYAQNVTLDDTALDDIIAIVKYANLEKNSDNTQEILSSLIVRFNEADYSNDLELIKLSLSLSRENSNQIYDVVIGLIDETFVNSDKIISTQILDYLLDLDENKKLTYQYISTMTSTEYLQELYSNYFDKDDNIDINLAFVANDNSLTLFSSSYKTYLDNLCTASWRDADLLEYINNSKNIVNIIGHDTSRKIIERVDGLRAEDENRKILDEALQTAQEAKKIAQEAKEMADSNPKDETLEDDVEAITKEDKKSQD